MKKRVCDIDEEGFAACMQEQRQKARDARKVSNYMGKDATVYDEIDPAVTSVFVGYDKTECESTITVLTNGRQIDRCPDRRSDRYDLLEKRHLSMRQAAVRWQIQV